MNLVRISPAWQALFLVAVLVAVALLWPESQPEPEIGTALRCFSTTDGIVCFES